MVPSASPGPMLSIPQGHVVFPHDLGLGAERRFNTIMHQFSFQTALWNTEQKEDCLFTPQIHLSLDYEPYSPNFCWELKAEPCFCFSEGCWEAWGGIQEAPNFQKCNGHILQRAGVKQPKCEISHTLGSRMETEEVHKEQAEGFVLITSSFQSMGFLAALPQWVDKEIKGNTSPHTNLYWSKYGSCFSLKNN